VLRIKLQLDARERKRVGAQVERDEHHRMHARTRKVSCSRPGSWAERTNVAGLLMGTMAPPLEAMENCEGRTLETITDDWRVMVSPPEEATTRTGKVPDWKNTLETDGPGREVPSSNCQT
jgi:hypothetical protein